MLLGRRADNWTFTCSLHGQKRIASKTFLRCILVSINRFADCWIPCVAHNSLLSGNIKVRKQYVLLIAFFKCNLQIIKRTLFLYYSSRGTLWLGMLTSLPEAHSSPWQILCTLKLAARNDQQHIPNTFALVSPNEELAMGCEEAVSSVSYWNVRQVNIDCWLLFAPVWGEASWHYGGCCFSRAQQDSRWMFRSWVLTNCPSNSRICIF